MSTGRYGSFYLEFNQNLFLFLDYLMILSIISKIKSENGASHHISNWFTHTNQKLFF